MSLRSAIMWLMPAKMKAAAEAESRSWIAACRHCGAETSIWEMGGIRYGGAGKRTTRIRCPSCGKASFVTFDKRRS